MLQLYNADSAVAEGLITYHPLGREASDSDAVIRYRLRPGEAVSYADLLDEALHLGSAIGFLELRASTGTPPLVVARLYGASGAAGPCGFYEPSYRPSDALTRGERAALIVPSGAGLELHVGALTVGAAATLNVTRRDAGGATRGPWSRRLTASSLTQVPAPELVGGSIAPGDVLTFELAEGSAILYGIAFDAGTGDSSFQAAAKLDPAFTLTSDFAPPTGSVGAWDGPGAKRLMTATSADGLTFTRTGQVVTDQGDVPDLAVDARGWIYLYYTCATVGAETNKTVVAISTDGGRTWVYKKLVLSGFEKMLEPVDPDIQILEDGTFRLYLTTSDSTDWNTAHTYYAEGTDGIHFTAKGSAFWPNGKQALDPSTLRVGSTWHIFSGGNTSGHGLNFHGTSSDGTRFEPVGELALTYQGVTQLAANAIPVPGGYRIYTFDSIPGPAAPVAIHSFFSADGAAWTADAGARLVVDRNGGKESQVVKDPTVVRSKDGTFLMVYVTAIP
jgi:hypothetical protein